MLIHTTDHHKIKKNVKNEMKTNEFLELN